MTRPEDIARIQARAAARRRERLRKVMRHRRPKLRG